MILDHDWDTCGLKIIYWSQFHTPWIKFCGSGSVLCDPYRKPAQVKLKPTGFYPKSPRTRPSDFMHVSFAFHDPDTIGICTLRGDGLLTFYVPCLHGVPAWRKANITETVLRSVGILWSEWKDKSTAFHAHLTPNLALLLSLSAWWCLL